MLIEESQHKALDDIVFEDRNKEYGAYTLRRSYYFNLQVALAVSVSLVLGVVFLYYLRLKFADDGVEGKENKLEIVMEEVQIPEIKPAAPPPPPPPPPELEEKKIITKAHTEIKLVENNRIDTNQVATQKDLDSSAIAKTTQEGDTLIENPRMTAPGKPGGTGIEDNKIYFPGNGVNAYFPGGEQAMGQYLSENLKSAMERAGKLGDRGTVYVFFVVEKDGTISNVKMSKGLAVCQSCNEEAKKVIENMPQWVPAENQQGNKVRMQFSIPITFNF